MQKGEKIAIKSGVDLKAVAAVFHDIGIDEARNDALFEESGGETLREQEGEVWSVRFFYGFQEFDFSRSEEKPRARFLGSRQALLWREKPKLRLRIPK